MADAAVLPRRPTLARASLVAAVLAGLVAAGVAGLLTARSGPAPVARATVVVDVPVAGGVADDPSLLRAVDRARTARDPSHDGRIDIARHGPDDGGRRTVRAVVAGRDGSDADAAARAAADTVRRAVAAEAPAAVIIEVHLDPARTGSAAWAVAGLAGLAFGALVLAVGALRRP